MGGTLKALSGKAKQGSAKGLTGPDRWRLALAGAVEFGLAMCRSKEESRNRQLLFQCLVDSVGNEPILAEATRLMRGGPELQGRIRQPLQVIEHRASFPGHCHLRG